MNRKDKLSIAKAELNNMIENAKKMEEQVHAQHKSWYDGRASGLKEALSIIKWIEENDEQD